MYVCSHWPIEGASNSVCASRDPSWFAVFAQPQQDAPRCQGLVYAVLVHSRSIPVLLGKLRLKSNLLWLQVLSEQSNFI